MESQLTTMAFGVLKFPGHWTAVKAIIEMVRARNDLVNVVQAQTYTIGTLLCDYFRSSNKPKANVAGGPFPMLLDYAVDYVDWTQVAKALSVYYDKRVSSERPQALKVEELREATQLQAPA